MRNLIIIALILALVGFCIWKSRSGKKVLVKKIRSKYADPKSPNYIKTFGASEEKLMKFDWRDLKALLADPKAEMKYTNLQLGE